MNDASRIAIYKGTNQTKANGRISYGGAARIKNTAESRQDIILDDVAISIESQIR